MSSGDSYGPWEVIWVDFTPQIGREQAGERPAIVVGSNLARQVGERNGLVIVVPCTSTDRDLPWQPLIVLNGRGCVAMCDQVKAVSVHRVVRRSTATLRPDEIGRIRAALQSLLVV